MLDHVGINCSDLAESSAFYDDVLGTLGHRRLMEFGVAIG
jgi:catechol 2,3-dioxygenase-like lactoylglutathione lyase family enzyme